VSEAEDSRDGAGAQSQRPLLELLLAGIGWASMGVEAADELADDIARRVGIDRAEMRAAVRDTIASWRREVEQAGGRREEIAERALDRIGVVRREEMDDLALRVAQLEHRLRLLEKHADS
jgi:polyhydroxyalkanoate synthesis regulator phasin